MPNTDNTEHDNTATAHGAAAAKTKRIEQEVIDEDLRVTMFRTPASPNWYIQYNLGHEQIKKSLGTKIKKEAKSRANKIARDLEAGAITNRSNRPTTLEQACEQRLTYLKAHKKRKPHTLDLNRRCFEQLMQWGRSNGVTCLNHLTLANLDRFEDALRDKGVPVPTTDPDAAPRKGTASPNSDKTVLDKMTAIRSLIKHSVRRDLIAADPSKGYDLPTVDAEEIQIFTPEELANILADPDPAMAEIWDFFRLQGVRVEEFCWLLKEDVCQETWTIMIRPKRCPVTGRNWQPKHGRERVVPLTPRAVEIVKKALTNSPGPWLFWAPNTQGKQKGKWRSQRLGARLQARLKACKIDHGTLHVFRHTVCSYLANDRNVPLPHLQLIMGHENIKTTMRYVHLRINDVVATMGKVDFTGMLAGTAKDGSRSSQLPVNGSGGRSESAA